MKFMKIETGSNLTFIILFAIIALWFLVTWGDPDIVDALIERISK